jgi:hypothetical protein
VICSTEPVIATPNPVASIDFASPGSTHTPLTGRSSRGRGRSPHRSDPAARSSRRTPRASCSTWRRHSTCRRASPPLSSCASSGRPSSEVYRPVGAHEAAPPHPQRDGTRRGTSRLTHRATAGHFKAALTRHPNLAALKPWGGLECRGCGRSPSLWMCGACSSIGVCNSTRRLGRNRLPPVGSPAAVGSPVRA